MAEPVAAPVHTSALPQITENEPHWLWKTGIRAGLCVIDVVAIGCAAWLLTAANDNVSDYNDYGYFLFPGTQVGSLVVLPIAFVWCLLFLTIPFILKPPRPIHPGWAVGGDLILWLGYIVVALFTTASIFNVVYYGSDGIIEDFSYSSNGYSGEYYLAPNNTWVYNITDVYGSGGEYYNYTTGHYQYPPFNPSSVVRDCTPAFASCAQQDAYVNKLWHEKSRLEGTTIVVAAVEWLGVLFHFILFVWACVDTHRYNAKKRVSTDQIVADKIIQDLEKRGLIQVRDGVVVGAGGAPNSSSNLPATAPLLAPTHQPRAPTPDAINQV